MATATRAVFPGSFDPFTVGHLDIVKRAASLYGRLTILVAESASKQPLLSVEERVELIQESTRGISGVRVEAWTGLVVTYARKNKISVIVRGLRSSGDFDAEFVMARMNRELAPKIETVFLVTSAHVAVVSSSMIKELLRFGGDVNRYLPVPVARALKGIKF